MFSALNAFRSRAACRAPAQAVPAMFFEVQLIDKAAGQYSNSGMPLTFFTERPQQVAGELLRDRDHSRWDVSIRAIA